MPYKFNPLTGTLDLVGSSSAASIDMNTISNKILTGTVTDLQREGIQSFELLFDLDGNLLARE